jgi:acyl-CoA synthetase (NDP forming)
VAGVSAWPKGLFEPEAVAVIGASDQLGSLGRLFVQNLLATYRGELYLVRTYPAVSKNHSLMFVVAM